MKMTNTINYCLAQLYYLFYNVFLKENDKCEFEGGKNQHTTRTISFLIEEKMVMNFEVLSVMFLTKSHNLLKIPLS